MKSAYLTFIIKVLIYSLVIVVITIILSFLLPKTLFSIALPFLFPFFIATTMISYLILLRSLHNKFSNFVNRFMLTTGIKLLLYALILVAYIFLFNSDAIPFVTNFFLLYLCYTIFETISLVKYSKVNQHKITSNAP